MSLPQANERSAAPIAITGIGIVSPLGVGRHETLEALRARRSGVHAVDGEIGPWRLGSFVPASFDEREWVQPRKSLKLMSHEIRLGVSAAAMALQDAGLAATAADPDRLGVVLGTDIMHCPPSELTGTYAGCRHEDGRFDFGLWAGAAVRELNPLWMLKYLPNMAASYIAIAHDARGPSNTLVLGDVSSLLAIIEGADIVRRGRADAVLAGGTGSLRNPTTRLYHGFAHLSRRFETPIVVPRPFDRDRDGTVCGEGAGIVLLERLDRALERGAPVYATIGGYGRSMKHLPGPDDDRAIRAAVDGALRAADWSVDSLDHVNATGRGTRDDDRREALAIRASLGELPVVAPSAAFGTLGAAGGAVELICSLLALHAGFRPAGPHVIEPDESCPIRPCNEPVSPRSGRFVKIGHAWTGQTAAVALEVPGLG